MALAKQIIRLHATYANLIAVGGDNELQLYMIGIATDTDEFIFRSDDGYHRCLDSGTTALSEHSIPFINSSGKVAEDNTNLQFNNGTDTLTTKILTTLNDINAAEYIKRSGVDDDYVRFENDKITVAAGGVTAFTFEDDKVYTALNTGIGESSPGTLLDMAGTSPYLTLHNTTHENIDGGRESKITWQGEKADGTLHSLFELMVSHSGSGDDEYGKYELKVNNNVALTSALLLATSKIGFASPKLMYLGRSSAKTPYGSAGDLCALEIGSITNITNENTTGPLVIQSNGYLAGSYKRYIANPATQFRMYTSNFSWWIAPTGAVDAAFTPLQVMTLSSTGATVGGGYGAVLTFSGAPWGYWDGSKSVLDWPSSAIMTSMDSREDALFAIGINYYYDVTDDRYEFRNNWPATLYEQSGDTVDHVFKAAAAGGVGGTPIPFTTILTLNRTDATFGNGISINCYEDITFLGATTENQIAIPTNLADALSIHDGIGDLMVFVTTTSSQSINITPDVTFSQQAIVTGNLQLGAGIIYPDADAVNSIRFTKADAATNVMFLDTTNNRVAIGGGGAPTQPCQITGNTRIYSGTLLMNKLSTAELHSTVTDKTGANSPFAMITNASTAWPFVMVATQNNADGCNLSAFKTRSPTTSGPATTIVQNGDTIMNIIALGADGVSYRHAAWIQATVDAAPAVGKCPGAWTFWATNSGGTFAQRMTVSGTDGVYFYQDNYYMLFGAEKDSGITDDGSYMLFDCDKQSATGRGFKFLNGNIWLDNARQAGDPTTDGYVLIKDSTGTQYKIPCEAV